MTKFFPAFLRCLALAGAVFMLAQTLAQAQVIPAVAVSDERGNFEASAYAGLAIDNFAAQESNELLYPAAAAGAKSSFVVGIDFAYRLVGNPANAQPFKGSQLWAYGKTIHGEQSGDVNCAQTTNPAICSLLAAAAPVDLPNTFYSVLRKCIVARSLLGAALGVFDASGEERGCGEGCA